MPTYNEIIDDIAHEADQAQNKVASEKIRTLLTILQGGLDLANLGNIQITPE
jgi:hypothetical protein